MSNNTTPEPETRPAPDPGDADLGLVTDEPERARLKERRDLYRINVAELRERCLMSFDDYVAEFEGKGGKLVVHDGPQGGGYIWYRAPGDGPRVLAVAHLDCQVDWCDHFYVLKLKTEAAAAASYSSLMPNATAVPPRVRIMASQLDDRLGAYLICDKLPELGIVTDILLTEGEESGKSTAALFDPEGTTYHWMFQFDRTGTDVVGYSYMDTPLWGKIARQLKWKTERGSFSDIASLMRLGVLGFNFGCGYHEYHSYEAYAWLDEIQLGLRNFLNLWLTCRERTLPAEPPRIPQYIRRGNTVYITYGAGEDYYGDDGEDDIWGGYGPALKRGAGIGVGSGASSSSLANDPRLVYHKPDRLDQIDWGDAYHAVGQWFWHPITKCWMQRTEINRMQSLRTRNIYDLSGEFISAGPGPVPNEDEDAALDARLKEAWRRLSEKAGQLPPGQDIQVEPDEVIDEETGIAVEVVFKPEKKAEAAPARHRGISCGLCGRNPYTEGGAQEWGGTALSAEQERVRHHIADYGVCAACLMKILTESVTPETLANRAVTQHNHIRCATCWGTGVNKRERKFVKRRGVCWACWDELQWRFKDIVALARSKSKSKSESASASESEGGGL